MKLFSHETTDKIKKAGVYAATALILATGSVKAQDQQAEQGPKPKYMKEFAELVVMLEASGRTDSAKKIMDNPTKYYDQFAQTMEKQNAEKQAKTQTEAVSGNFSVLDLTDKGKELYNAIVTAKSFEGEVLNQNKSFARDKGRLTAAETMLKIKNAEPELHTEIIQKAFGKVKYDEQKGEVSMTGKDGKDYFKKTRPNNTNAIPSGALFKAQQNGR